MKKILSIVLLTCLLAMSFSLFVGCGKKEIVIYVDGGGANGNFNTTASMNKTPENPYPYNTLETLAGEYMAANPSVKIVINKNSLNSDREQIVTLLSAEEAPHLLYQIVPGILEDVDKGWYVDLTKYFNQPNQYCEPGTLGSEKWMDIYNQKELLATQAPNGNYYTACLEKIPIGILYNKSLLEQAGITKLPDTYGEMLAAQKTLSEKTSKVPYFPIYTWYDIVLENSIFSKQMNMFDSIREDSFVDVEELIRCYNRGEWGIKGPAGQKAPEYEKMYREYFRLMKEKTKYYPTAWESYNALDEFLRGNVAMIEATGGHMIQANNDTTHNFEVGVFGFPTLTAQDSIYGGNGVYRGTAGLTTGWYVTNSAIRDGDETVEACVDFMRFLSAPNNNNRLINDLGRGMPLSAEAEVNELFKPLVDIYEKDQSDPNRYDWNAYCSWSDMGKEYYDRFLITVQSYQKNSIDIEEAMDIMHEATQKAVAFTMKTNNWTADRWK